MLMTFGFFVFDRRTAPYEELQRQTQWRHASQAPIGSRPSYQYLGPGEDKITLSGTLYPEITGGRVSLDLLRVMAEGGKGWPLIEGTGRIYGFWSATDIQETSAEFMQDGLPQKITFILNLTRVDENRLDLLGTATNAMLNAATGVFSQSINRLRL